ncbi:NAD(P)/FAD-dependent oxidoreductase [Ferviditalea candida]|uniref:FAD-binding oxidoreductase n=1 Tax=Ferviditalea candida TaxID=3108399 RepID=A0ABU5ZED0_9BACL|nr:FAD-binding oxidoreductase [Paenibacillaceae bacterium T2]
MDLVSVWEATANPSKPRSSLEGDHYCDVVVIGAGFTGLSTAYHLQKNNTRTIVLEQSKVGAGGSGRNGGQILTGYLHSMSALVKQKGLDAARQMLQMSLDSIALIESITQENGISCSFQRKGHLAAAYKPSHLEELKKEQQALQRDFNYSVKIVEKRDLPNELKTDFYFGGSIDETSASFHPMNYALGLAEAVENQGGTIFERSPARSIERDAQNRVVVKTEHGRVIANELVIATNAYSGNLHPLISKTIIPVESIMIATEQLPEKLAQSLIPQDRSVYDTKYMLYYFRRTPDNRIAFGGSGRTTGKRDARELFLNLRAGMVKVFPELEKARIEYSWSGKVGFTRERLPYIGKLKDGTHFAYGYAGHGAAMSTLMGKLLAANIRREQRGEGRQNPLEINELRPIPFYSQSSKVVGLMKYYYKFLDYIS